MHVVPKTSWEVAFAKDDCHAKSSIASERTVQKDWIGVSKGCYWRWNRVQVETVKRSNDY